jgi:hypothetical protein
MGCRVEKVCPPDGTDYQEQFGQYTVYRPVHRRCSSQHSRHFPRQRPWYGGGFASGVSLARGTQALVLTPAGRAALEAAEKDGAK